MDEKIPILVVGDSPHTSTGLGRICRDLMNRLHQDEEALGITLGGLFINWDGMPQPWPVWPVREFDKWAERDLPYAWNWHARGKLGVIFTIWDPARCFAFVKSPLPSGSHRRWGYFAIDGANREGKLGGIAETAVREYDRVLAYGRYGATVVHETLGGQVSYLPHGIVSADWAPRVQIPGPPTLVGAVVSNQPRKNLALLFETWEILAKRDPTLKFWLHTDLEVTQYWAVPQLAADYGLNDPDYPRLIVTGTEKPFDDHQLAQMYRASLVTLAPSLGEGFGYPIVESLAAGTPVIHYDGAGGAELVPLSQWRVQSQIFRIEGALNWQRPILDPQVFAEAAWDAIQWRRREPEVVEAYCRGAVAHLEWELLWPRWRQWFKSGLDEMRKKP